MSAPKSLAHTVYSSPPVAANLADIEKTLAGLWDSVSPSAGAVGGQTLTRACMSNLVVYCDSQADANTVLEYLPRIVEVHPARILFLVGETSEAEDLTAFVSVHYRSVSEGWQLCAEQVTVYCHKSAAKRLPSIPRALCIGNLPIALWWVSNQPPPLAGEIFHNLAAGADQVIFDSIGWRDPAQGIQAVARWIAGNEEQVIYNLAWRRLKAWRKLMSESLAPEVTPGALHNVKRLEIEHGPHALPVAWMLVGWLAVRLKWRPVSAKVISQSAITWRFEREDGRVDVLIRRRDEGEARVYQLLWHWAGNGDCTVTFSRLGERTLGVKSVAAHVAETVIAMPDVGHAELVAQQLAHRFHDELFEDVLALSDQMVGVLGK
ncbi:glucose-6-phosphate dehydrogenase assembly protein OpcA [Methylogaea oryzae]|uniref:Glucose-6-phosphate dehydrogenase subunit n=1 Tax=Methylogaea oryzae TaxID=1295382 RepID=A0A8D4VP88_9GAMM|nr:glucose-6-phosphate dehydrogenase assembly protein OpcA [Methylogaea oryzae]BBL71538.1 hypothetical protein MoryE10_21440 [Methylogaea oryzae]